MHFGDDGEGDRFGDDRADVDADRTPESRVQFLGKRSELFGDAPSSRSRPEQADVVRATRAREGPEK